MNKENKYIQIIDDIKTNITDICIRNLKLVDEDVFIIYIQQLTDRNSLSNNIIKPLLQYNYTSKPTIEKIVSSIMFVDDIIVELDESKIADYLLEGKTIIILLNSNEYIIANTFKVEKRTTESPEIQSSIRSPKDAFTESIDSNISLIRYRIKDKALKIDYFKVGVRTKTSVAVIYIKDIANSKYVEEIKSKLNNIHIDGIMESGYIQKFISEKNNTLFPQIGISERSDSACANILEGKVCIIVDGSNLALIAPKSFIEFLDAGDDHYDSIYVGIFTKSLRFLALTTTLSLSALYVAVVAFHADILPAQYILTLASSRVTVPVNALVEVTLMEIIVELLREASIRLPKAIGPAIGIVGTIVIGQAAVSAGLVSPLIVIIVSLSLMCSFAMPDYTIMASIRLLKFMMIFLTGVFGLFGFIMGYTLIIIKIASINSFGIPYTAPVSPFNYNDMKNYIMSNIKSSKERPNFLNPKDKKRQ
ncbi:spore germination protein [Clostridium malenominatum]|uniref:Spore germination protein n=1 Tax=Clostridium malenominatum TaxID=1539 RepID=A0ABN1IMM3_9CLOT